MIGYLDLAILKKTLDLACSGSLMQVCLDWFHAHHGSDQASSMQKRLLSLHPGLPKDLPSDWLCEPKQQLTQPHEPSHIRGGQDMLCDTSQAGHIQRFFF
jgi:hypothetical protein